MAYQQMHGIPITHWRSASADTYMVTLTHGSHSAQTSWLPRPSLHTDFHSCPHLQRPGCWKTRGSSGADRLRYARFCAAFERRFGFLRFCFVFKQFNFFILHTGKGHSAHLSRWALQKLNTHLSKYLTLSPSFMASTNLSQCFKSSS